MKQSGVNDVRQGRERGQAGWAVSIVAAAALLAGCGGGTDGASGATEQATDSGSRSKSAALVVKPTGTNKWSNADTPLPTHAQAVRFLSQASFGVKETDVSRLMTIGYAAWVDEQLAMPANGNYYYARYKAEDAAAKGGGTRPRAGADTVISSFYTQALTAPDQLRQRVAFALSQILVVSTMDVNGENTAAVASYMDMINRNALGGYRRLLEDVAMHPAMGDYLSHMKNRKEDTLTGRVPDQNFAREIMQLFSIGLVQLNLDGTPKLDPDGRALPTYTQDDVIGMSRVFTGFSWGGPDQAEQRFFGSVVDAERVNTPMQGYAKFHSMLEKRFLGVTIAPQATADPAASLRVALDTLAAHANVGPFIARQLIQRLVESNPSAAYVRRIATVFNNNGAGVRGDLKAVVRAILLDGEARSAKGLVSDSYGKLREPVVRLTNYLRSYGATSDSGKYLITNTDDPGLQLGQTPVRSPTVFNFYRPGYVPPTTMAGAAGLTVPEMQITNEASVAGYVNYMQQVVDYGVGQRGVDNIGTRMDVQVDFTTEVAMATDATALTNRVTSKLLPDQTAVELKAQIVEGVNSIILPPLKADGSNQAFIETMKRKRVNLAVLMTLASHEYIVQR